MNTRILVILLFVPVLAFGQITLTPSDNSAGAGALFAYAFKAVPQNAADAQFTPVQFDSISIGAAHTTDLGTTWVLPPGKYLVISCVGFGQISSEVTIQCLVSLFVNGSEVARLGRQYLTAPDNWHQTVIGMHILDVAEQSEIHIAAYQDKSGDQQPISTDDFTTWIQIYKFQ